LGVYGGNPGYGRQQTGAREPPNFISGSMPGCKSSDHALTLQPLNAGFQPLKIDVAIGLVGATCRGRLLVRPESSEMAGIRIQGIGQISEWRNHARMLPVAPPIGSPLDRFVPMPVNER
jgi:hypothetical protein